MCPAPDDAADSGIPAIRTFQFDSTSLGSLPSAVNLFRGDVGLPQTLFTLPGRHSGGGLDVDLTLLYQSNVLRQTTLWNRDGPTGVVGLGWDLPLTYIEATSTGSPDPETRSYVLYDGGTPNALIRQPAQPLLFSLPGTVTLAPGEPVGADVRAAFQATGLALAESAQVTADGSALTIEDAEQQQSFAVAPSPRGYDVTFGGWAFQLQDYRFWQITYFPEYERWLVVTDDGIRKSFGGVAAATTDGYRTAVGNSIGWEVWWGANGVPSWTGPSGVVSGQVQVASSWYLAAVSDRFGDTVRYGYNGFARGGDGLLTDVEQQVGAGGKPYTKAVYLTQITDVFGRTATLAYGDKQWDDSAPSAPREYADPHRATPGNTPNAYQDRYETKYLASVALAAADGTPLSTIVLDSKLAAVTSPGEVPAGDLVKRFVVAITLLDAQGTALPGYVYDYFWDDGADGAQAGALRTITTPQGGTAAYRYEAVQLTACDRVAAIDRPTADSVPRVFFGDDYSVVVWWDASSENGGIRLQAQSWYGRWIPWSPTADGLIDGGAFEASSIDVIAASDFFVLTFERPTGTAVGYVFNKVAGSPGTFAPADLQGTTTAADTPTYTIDTSEGAVEYSAGATFFAVSQLPADTGRPGSYQVFSYSWTTRAWSVQAFSPSHQTVLVADDEYLLALDAAGTATMRYRDGALEWQAAPELSDTRLSFPPAGAASVAAAAGPGVAAVNFLEAGNPLQRTYRVVVLQWDANHTLSLSDCREHVEAQPHDDNILPWSPVVSANRLVAVNGFLSRYDGSSWLPNASMVVNAPMQMTQQRYAYGPDYALQVLTNPVGIADRAQALAYDPDAPGAWTAAPATIELPYPQLRTDDFPYAGADYALLGPELYFRGTATDWTTVLGADASATIDELVSQSVVYEAPDFLSYPVDENGTSGVRATTLRNGDAIAVADLPADERMFSAGPGIAAGPGTSPQGPDTFVTYSGAAFDEAGTVLLHRYAGDAVSGPLTHDPVAQIAIDDGLGTTSTTTYARDLSRAACDPSGLVVKYYETTTYPGGDQSSPTYGWSVNRYLNGLQAGGGQDYYDMLDGLLVETATYDSAGALLEDHVSNWAVFDAVASDPVDPDAPPVPLRGGWVGCVGQSDTVDGVGSSKSFTFVPDALKLPYTGQIATVTTTSSDGAGRAETWTETKTYGVEVSDALRALNVRTEQAQAVTIREQDAVSVVVRASATAFAPWPAVSGAQVPAEEASFQLLAAPTPGFPFAAYAPGSTPDGWLPTRRVTARTGRGQIIGSVDGGGLESFTLFSADEAYPVAQLRNAVPGSAAYTGFEPYEDLSAWTLEATEADDGRARTGTTSLRLPAGASARLAVTLSPMPNADRYLVGFWYRTPAGFTPETGVGCTAVAGGAALAAGFDDTGGEWAFKTLGVPIDGQSIAVTLANPSSTDVWLDSVHVVPLASSLIARIYDPSTRSLTATMDAGGRTRWMQYDSFERPTLQLGPGGQPKELAQRFLSRQGGAAGTFDPSAPNAELTLHPAGGGTAETFRDGDAWQRSWKPSDAGAWQAANGALAHAGSDLATLSYQGTVPSTFAVYFELAAAADTELTITSGDVSVGWSAGAYTAQAGSPLEPLAAPPSAAMHWLLVAGSGVVLFFADGQLLFAQTGAFAFGPPVISAGSPLALTNLAVLAQPRLGVTHLDGCARQRQVHQLHGADSRVSALIYDPLGRVLATTRVAPGSFGSGAAQPPLQYRPGFVDVSGFLATAATTGAMSGDVADYYRGQVQGNGVQRSDDQGYPYRGARWEPSSRDRKLELGLPGRPYAIADPATVAPADRATAQLAYGPNDATFGLPGGQYAQTTVTTALKAVNALVDDRLGQRVAAGRLSDGQLTTRSAGVRSYGAEPTASLAQDMPNALVSGPQGDDGSFVRRTVVDGCGRTIATADPNCGETDAIHDAGGRVRFAQPSLDPGAVGFLYSKYDPLGRILEIGSIPQPWTPDTLAAKAADPGWPDATVQRTVTRSWTYDGDGNLAGALGQKTACVTTTTPPSGVAAVAAERFAYDDAGRLIAVTLDVSGAAAASGAIGYAYNNLGELTALTMPAGAPLDQVVYSIDDQGSITGIGTSLEAATNIAGYTYAADGCVEVEQLGDGAWTRSTAYLSPGWVSSLETLASDGAQRVDLSYTYNADGTVSGRTVDYALTALTETIDDTFEYDGQGRLAAAGGSSDEQITSYDPNGNVWTAVQSGDALSFEHAAGTDRLSQTTIAGDTLPVSYDARGRMTQSLGRTLSYDAVTGLTTAASTASAGVQLGYGGQGQRVLKITDAGAQTTYYTGASTVPVARTDGAAWTSFVYGPKGLVAMYADRAYYPLSDGEQSVWAVVDQQGLVARTAYLPFGAAVRETLAEADGPPPSVLAHRYMGQEWDPELSLYNFRARMYDPVLRRFLAPDPQRQFPSPYVFCGDNPLGATDPSGELSLWGRIGIGLAMAAVAIGGIVATVATGGAAAPEAAAGEVALGAELGAVSAASTAEASSVGVSAGIATEAAEIPELGAVSAASAAQAGPAGVSAAIVTTEAGGGAAAAAAAGPSIGITFSWQGLVAGSVTGFGESGLQYDIQHGRHFTAAGFFEAAGWGALGGALSGGFSPALKGVSTAVSIGVNVAFNGVTGAASNGVTAVLANVADGKKWDDGLAMSVGIGFGEGAFASGAAEGLKASGIVGRVQTTVGRDAVEALQTAVERVQTAARSPEATGVYVVVGFFVVSGFTVGGAYGAER